MSTNQYFRVLTSNSLQPWKLSVAKFLMKCEKIRISNVLQTISIYIHSTTFLSVKYLLKVWYKYKCNFVVNKLALLWGEPHLCLPYVCLKKEK